MRSLVRVSAMSRVRERPELEVVVRVGALLQRRRARRRAAPARRRRAAGTRARSAASRRRRRRARRATTRAARSSSPPSQRALAAVGQRPARRTRPGAERFGSRAPVPCVPVRERAGERLHVDVAEVGHRQPARVQLARERVQADPGLDADEPARGVGVEHARRARRADSSVPSVATPPLNECPAPATRTGAGPPATALASSCARARVAASAPGARAASRDQLRHSIAPRTVPSAAMDVAARRGGRAAARGAGPADRRPRGLRVGGGPHPGRAPRRRSARSRAQADDDRPRASLSSSTAASAPARRWPPQAFRRAGFDAYSRGRRRARRLGRRWPPARARRRARSRSAGWRARRVPGGCVTPSGFAAPAPAAPSLVTVGVFPRLPRDPPPGEHRLFVVEQAGRVRVMVSGRATTPFLDITPSRVGRGSAGCSRSPSRPTTRAAGLSYVS